MPSARLVSAALLAVCLPLLPTTVEGAALTEQFVFADANFPPPGVPAGSAWYIGTEAQFCSGNCLRTSATVLFDLSNTVGTNASNQGVLFVELTDPSLQTIVSLPQAFQSPTTDASGYTPGSGFSSATLTLGIRGLDTADDNVLITAFAVDGGAILFQNVYSGSIAATQISIPFNAALLAALGGDGQFGISVTSFGTDINTHDFNLDSATLEATSVPEPSTLLLLGAGLAALRKRVWRKAG